MSSAVSSFRWRAPATRLSQVTNRSVAGASHERSIDRNHIDIRHLEAGDMTDVGSRAALVAPILFAAIALLIGVDVAADYRSGADAGHLVTEGSAMALALSGAVVLWRQLRQARRQTGELTVALERARHEAALFREEAREALRG